MSRHLQEAVAAAMVRTIGDGASLVLYDGEAPSEPDDPTDDLVLVEVPITRVERDGATVRLHSDDEVRTMATGHAGWVRLRAGDGRPLVDMSCGVHDPAYYRGDQFNLNSQRIVRGGVFRFRMPLELFLFEPGENIDHRRDRGR